MSNYKSDLIDRFWKYQKERFPDCKKYFDRQEITDQRPPVFLKSTSDHNVIVNPDLPVDKRKALLEEIPLYERHRWFRSMSSSQALAQSIFVNFKLYEQLILLNDLNDDLGEPLFGPADITVGNFKMEYSIDYLGEPRRTSVDAFISGDYQVAIECKLTESEVGSCSRPRLRNTDSNYDKDFCDGTYTYQNGRDKRCSLTKRKILYWKYIPRLFNWRSDIDLKPCPVNKNYQLVRNILAACVRPDGTLSPENGHMVLIYDERNPAFQKGGKGYTAFEETRMALRFHDLLKKFSWQRITKYLQDRPEFQWLSKELVMKYGL